MPSPCSGSPGSFVQASATKALAVDARATAAVMRSCRPQQVVADDRRRCSCIGGRVSRLQRAVADVAAELRAVEADAAATTS